MNSTTKNKLTKVYSNLYKFSRWTYGPKYIQGTHIKRLCGHLAKIAKGESKRLIVNMPPRHSKTQTCSINFPVWMLFQDPNKTILVITYGDDLSEGIGTKARALIKEHGHYFNVYLSSHTASKTKIRLQDRDGNAYRGGIEALGYKGAITGKDADIIIIDDLIKGPEDALSPAQNKKIVEFYKSAIYTRLFEDSIVIVVSTRWSKTDLAGHLLDNSVEQWDTLILPAVNDEGEPLWPERFTKERMAVIAEEEGSFWWSALYLQEPEELKGDVFEGEFITVPLDEVDTSKFERLVCYIDRAATEQKGGNDPDYTAILLMALLNDGSYLVLYVKRFRKSPAGNKVTIKNTLTKLKKWYGGGIEVFIELEGGSGAKDSYQQYKTEILTDFKVQSHNPSGGGSKHIRAIDVASDVEIGKVKFVKAKWNGPIFLEMRAFPHGSHDDMVDTLSGSYNTLRKKKTVLKPRRRR